MTPKTLKAGIGLDLEVSVKVMGFRPAKNPYGNWWDMGGDKMLKSIPVDTVLKSAVAKVVLRLSGERS